MKRGGIPLGLKLENQYVCQAFFQLVPGDVAVFLTDGIEEAMNADEDFFGMERTLNIIRDHREKPAAEIIKQMFDTLDKFTGSQEQQDDLTIVIVKVL